MDELNEKEIYAGLVGEPLPEGAESSENEPVASQDANQEEDAGGEAQESAPPAVEEAAGGEEEGSRPAEPHGDPVGAPGEPGGVSHVPTQAERDHYFAQKYTGMWDPYAKRPITSEADFLAYQQAYQAEQEKLQRQRLTEAGVDMEALDIAISQHPAVKQAQALVEEAQHQRAEAQKAQAQEWYAGQLREIATFDPEIKSLQDLQGKDPAQYGRMLALVSGGASLVEAYKALNFDAIMSKRVAAAQQSERNKAAGKAHLTATTPMGGDGAVEVPNEVKAMYRELNPDMTGAEIEQAYAAYLKENQ